MSMELRSASTVCLVPQMTASDLSGFKVRELNRSHLWIEAVQMANLAEMDGPVDLLAAMYSCVSSAY